MKNYDQMLFMKFDDAGKWRWRNLLSRNLSWLCKNRIQCLWQIGL